MGNIQCYYPTTTTNSDRSLYEDRGDDVDAAAFAVALLRSAESTDNNGESRGTAAGETDEAVVYRTRTEKRFLGAHREAPPNKVLIDTREVAKALIEQAGEIMRREIALRMSSDNSIESAGTGEDGTGDEEVSEVIPPPSIFSPTEITTVSAATQLATNLDPSSPYRRKKGNRGGATSARLAEEEDDDDDDDETENIENITTGGRRSTTPRIKSEKAFLEKQLLYENVQSVLESTRKRYAFGDNGRGRKGGAKATTGATGDLRRLLKYDCGVLMCLEDQENIDYIRKVQQHSAVLYLRIDSLSALYYQNHLSKSMPAGQNDIAAFAATSLLSHQRRQKQQPNPILLTTAPSPKRSFPQQGTPGLASSVVSDSTSSGEHVVEWGTGPPSRPVQLLLTETVFLELGITGSLGLVDRRIPRYHESQRRRPRSPEHYVVLLNRRTSIPLAVCALKKTAQGPPTVRIYATKPRFFRQHPVSTTAKLGLNWSKTPPLPLYPWADMVCEGTYPDRVRYSIFMASGADSKFEESPRYRAVHDSCNCPEIRVVGRTEREKEYSGCAVMTLCRDEDDEDFRKSGTSVLRDVIDEDDGTIYFRLSISKGIDPALLICFSAFVDEYIEKFMRSINYHP